MARQNRTKAADTTVEGTDTTTEEPTVAEQTEAPEATTEAPAEETPADLTAFKQAVTEALAEGDTSTGQLPADAIGKVNEQYRSVEGNKGKREARDYLQAQMLEAVGKLDAVAARGYSDLSANLSAAGGARAERAPADPAAAFVQRRASLELALQIVNSQAPEVEGLDEKVAEVVAANQEVVNAHLAYVADESEDKGEAPELNPVVRAAVKAASGKATGARASSGGGSGVRRDTGKHIVSAFAEVEVGGFLTIAEIAKHKSEEYGDDSPSQGAISARLFPTTTLEGIEPINKGDIDGKNPKGARKTA